MTPRAVGSAGESGPSLFERIDHEIRSVFPEELLITPDLVRGSSATLAEAIATTGWPKLGAVRGRVMFGFDCNRDVCLGYVGDEIGNHWVMPQRERLLITDLRTGAGTVSEGHR